MNIVLIHYAASPVVGGVETVMARHARLMAEAGHRVCILAGRGDQTNPLVSFSSVPEIDSRNPEVLALKAELDVGRVPAEFESLVQRLASQLHVALAEADRVIAHNVCSLNKNLALTAALHRVSERARQPHFMLWHHDLAWTTPRYQKELHDGYPWDLLRVDWPWATQVVVSRQRQRELAELVSVPASRIHVIPNGLDVPEFLKLEPQTRELVKRYDLTRAAPLMLLPVRITPRKNIELALHSLAALRTHFPDAMLLVTGPLGPHSAANRGYMQRLLMLRAELHMQAQAIFLAEALEQAAPDAVIADLYRLADLLFLPSREEGFGIPVLEAGLAGMPVLCSDIPALREIGGAQAHYFSANAAPAALADQIAKLLQTSATYQMRKKVLAGFTWDAIYGRHIAPLLEKD